MMKDLSTLPSHLTDKDVSSSHEPEGAELGPSSHLSHELGQSLLQSESRIPNFVPTSSLNDTFKYTKIKIQNTFNLLRRQCYSTYTKYFMPNHLCKCDKL